MWLRRLQTLVKGEIFEEGASQDVPVNEIVLRQLVSQGFEKGQAEVALKRANNDAYSALIILTCPEDTTERPEDLEDDSDEAKQQRLIEFFKDLGDQYWGWQNESAKRGRGFKGALKENFLPLLEDIRQVAAGAPKFCRSAEAPYRALGFVGLGLDECPPAFEDRDRDRHRMSMETAGIVPKLVSRIAELTRESFKDSLTCELTKSTFSVLDKLVVQAVASQLQDSERLESCKTIVKFVMDFDEIMAISLSNEGLQGASGKFSAVQLHPAIRSLALFLSSSSTTASHHTTIAQQLALLVPLLKRNDPSVLEAVLQTFQTFVVGVASLPAAEGDAIDDVLRPLMAPEPMSCYWNLLLSRSTSTKIHNLVLSLVSSVCQHSFDALELVVGDVEKFTINELPLQHEQGGLLAVVCSSLQNKLAEERFSSALGFLQTLLTCIKEGHKCHRERNIKSTDPVIESYNQKRSLYESMQEEDIDEIELREMLDHDEYREELVAVARHDEDADGGHRAELEVHLQRLRRAKLARCQEMRARRRFGESGGPAEISGSARISHYQHKDLISGTRVKRGQHWKWSGQDGGEGSQGVVVSGTEKNTNGWVRVQWDKGGVNGYRWGAENAYDLETVDTSWLSSSLRSKDVSEVQRLLKEEKPEGFAQQEALGLLFETIALADEHRTDSRDKEILVSMLEHLDIDINTMLEGKLAIVQAAKKGLPDIVDGLLERGAQLSKDGDGVDAIQAVSRQMETMSEEFSSADFARYSQVVRMLEVRSRDSTTRDCECQPIRHFFVDEEADFERSVAGFRFPCPLTLEGETSFTVSMSLFQSGTRRQGRSCLLSFGQNDDGEQGFTILSTSRGQVSFTFNLGEHEPECTLNLARFRGRWVVISCVYKLETHRLDVYVDGCLAMTSDYSTAEERPSIHVDGEMSVACAPADFLHPDVHEFQGKLSDIRLYTTTMSAESLKDLHESKLKFPADAHPHLLSKYSEFVCRTLLASFCKAYDGNVKMICHTWREGLLILSRVLPSCSSDFFTHRCRKLMMQVLDGAVAGFVQKNEETKLPTLVKSAGQGLTSPCCLTLCILDSLMSISPTLFSRAFKRSGILGRLQSLARAPSSTLSIVTMEQDLALCILETHFKEESEIPPSDVEEQLHRMAQSLMAALQKVRDCAGDEGEHLAIEIVRQVCSEIADLLISEEGVCGQEIADSRLPAALLALFGSSRRIVDMAMTIFRGTTSHFTGLSAFDELKDVLLLSTNHVPACIEADFPLIATEAGCPTPKSQWLKQWVTLRVQKMGSGGKYRDVSGHEIRVEPLAFVSAIQESISHLIAAASREQDKESRQRDRERRLGRGATDPASGHPLEHIRHIIDYERCGDVIPHVTRTFSALPPTQSWDRDTINTGSRKWRLNLGKQQEENPCAGNEVPSMAIDDQPEAPFQSAADRLRRFGRLETEGYDASKAAKSIPDLPSSSIQLRLHIGGRPPSRTDSALAASTEYAFGEEEETGLTMSEEEARAEGEEARYAPRESQLLQTSCDNREVGIEIRPDETMFEALCRLSAKGGAETARGEPTQCLRHPGRFWERVYVLKYKFESEQEGADEKSLQSTQNSISNEIGTSSSEGGGRLRCLQNAKLRDCLLLLDQFSRGADQIASGHHSFASQALTLHLRRQLEDPLTLGSGLLSSIQWVKELCSMHAVIPLAVREKYFFSSAFGTSRALASLHGLQSEDPLPQPDTAVLVRAFPRRYPNVGIERSRLYFERRAMQLELKIPALQHETVEVDHLREGHEDKPALWKWAEWILNAHGSKETVLDVTWKGEAGHGSGPTRKFFEKVASDLEGSSGLDVNCWRDVTAARSEGLFPAELPTDQDLRSQILKRFKLIGTFIGKSLQQKQMPGLCLAKPLFKLILGEEVCFDDVKEMDNELARSVLQLKELKKRKDEIMMLNSNKQQILLQELDEELCMLENMQGDSVHHQNLGSYLDEVEHDCVKKLRVCQQVKAIRDGIDQVFAWQKLRCFSPAELQFKLWSKLEWDERKLQQIVRPGPLWPDDAQQIEWLRENMLRMDPWHRRALVKFVTACSCMPSEDNPIIVHPQVSAKSETEKWDQKLPTCRTCANYMYLPHYSNPLILEQKLNLAIWEEHIAFD